MKAAGGWLLTIGVAIALGAILFIDTTVRIEPAGLLGPGLGTGVPFLRGEVYNLGLLQARELTFQGGCALAIVGAILFAGGAIVEAMGAPLDATRDTATVDLLPQVEFISGDRFVYIAVGVLAALLAIGIFWANAR